MNIIYKEEKLFKIEEIESLFLSVNWISGTYPELVTNGLNNSSVVISAWHNDKLVGLIRTLEDGHVVDFAHDLLVHPNYQGLGIAGTLISKIKEKYKDYLFFNIMPDDKKNVAFYEKHGFNILESGTAMQIFKP